jgi:hypothetical protein
MLDQSLIEKARDIAELAMKKPVATPQKYARTSTFSQPMNDAGRPIAILFALQLNLSEFIVRHVGQWGQRHQVDCRPQVRTGIF